MANTRSIRKQIKRRTDHVKKRSAAREQIIAQTQRRRQIFSLTPTQLEALYQTVDDVQDDALDQASDIEAASLDDEAFDTEIDLNDPDDFVSNQEQDVISDASMTVTAEIRREEHAILDLKNCYRLCVMPRENDSWQCRFQAPSWMSNHAKQTADPLRDLIDTLNTLADWLEHEKQTFLRDPSPETYALSPCGNHEEPAVTRKGLQSILNKRYEYKKHEKREMIKKDDFSYLKNKIWIFWPDFCFSIETLFSKEFQSHWVLMRCEEKASLADWCNTEIYFISHEEIKAMQNQDPKHWNLSQAIAIFCKPFRSAINPDQIHHELIKKSRKNG